MEKQINGPKLRFPQFNDFWVKRQLGEIGEVVNGLTYSPDDIDSDGILVLRSSNIKDSRILLDDNVFVKIEKFNPVYTNDILICVRNGSKNLIGKNAIIGNEIEGVAFGAFMTVFRSDSNLFVFQLLSTSKYYQRISENLGATINSINSSDLRKFKFYFPTSQEQTKIANFLSSVDDRLTQLKKKKNLLEQYKKGIIQKIFSQELRFKDEDGNDFEDWGIKRLGDFLKKYDEKSTINNQFPVLTSSRKGLFFQKDYFDGNDVASKDNTGYNVVPRNYFTYRHMSDDVTFKFNINKICDKGIVSTLYPVFTTSNMNSEFLQLILNEGIEFQKYAIEQKQGGSRTYMYFNKLENLYVCLPSLAEQTKIANFLSAIDDKINQCGMQIEKMELWKKGLLQQMFC